MGIPAGKARCTGPGFNHVICYGRDDDILGKYFDEINGVVLENEAGCRFGAAWDDSLVNISEMKIWKEEAETGEKENLDFKVVQNQEENSCKLENDSESEDDSEAENGSESEDGSAGENSSEARKEQECGIKRNYTGMPEASNCSTDEEVPGIKSEIFPGMKISVETDMKKQKFRVRKIQRMEISKLARCEWKLANNQFLMHGYYNYHHLGLLENGSQVMLGVPGIYHEKEKKAAEIFGFPTFISIEELEVSLDPEEKNEEETFGYWCRPVKKQMRWE